MEKFIENIKDLARERPLYTIELFVQNDCYGYAHILKRYAEVDLNYQIKSVLEHSALLYDHVWKYDIVAPLPSIFTFSDYRFPFIRQFTNKALFAIGPSIHYAKCHFSDDELKNLRKQLGKTLLVFLPHSSWSTYIEFDTKKILSVLKNLEREFDNIMICLGWKEVLRDIEKPFIAEGYSCVTAGHIYDKNFLDRLKTIILLSSHTVSFSYGTHIGFCIYLNKPHWVISGINQKVNVINKIDKATAIYKPTPLSKNQVSHFLSYFKEPRDDISKKQQELVDIIWGISHVKTKKELRELFEITEDMYKSKYMPCDKTNPITISQLADYIDKKELKKAKILLEYSKKMGFSKKWITLFDAFIDCCEENKIKAEKKLKMIVKTNGFIKNLAERFLTNLDNNFSLSAEILNVYPKPKFFSPFKINLPWRLD